MTSIKTAPDELVAVLFCFFAPFEMAQALVEMKAPGLLLKRKSLKTHLT